MNIFNGTISFIKLILGLSVLLNFAGCKAQANQKVNTRTKSEVPTINNENPEHQADIILNQYKDDKKDGFWRTYHQNSQLKSEGNYSEDLKEGLHREWDENEILLLEGYYEKGKANGLMKWFHDRGHLAGEGNMRDDIRFGKWKICDVEENGFCIEAYFKEGKRDGVWKINHANARDKLWKEQTFKDDKIVSEKCWDESGKVIECK